MGAFPHQHLSARDVASMALHWPSTTATHQKSPFPWEQNSGQLLEKAVTLERLDEKEFLLSPHIANLTSYGNLFEG